MELYARRRSSHILLNSSTFNGTLGATTPASVAATTLSTTGDISLPDGAKAIFGAGSDLQIYHDGSNSYIQSTTGNLNFTTAGGAEFAVTAANNGAVTLFHDGSTKLTTTATGIDVTGTVTADGLDVDTGDAGNGLNYGFDVKNAASGSATSYAMPAISWSNGGLRWASVHGERNPAGGYGGSFVVNTMNSSGSAVKRLGIDSGGDISFYEDTGTTAKFFWDASAESLGIGTISPVSKLQVRNDSDTDYNPSTAAFNTILTLQNNTSGASNNALLSFTTESNGEWYIGGVQNSGNTAADFVFASRASGARAERMRIDASGNVGLGVVPSAWGSYYSTINAGSAGNLSFFTGQTNAPVANVGVNLYNDNTNFRYAATGAASFYQQYVGEHRWYNVASGGVGDIATPVQAMTLDASGDLTTTGAATFGGNVTGKNATFVTTTAASLISIGDTAAGTYSLLRMYGGSGKYNFQVGVQNNVNNAFEITPSTAVGGTTFTTPALLIDGTTGAATFSSTLSVGNIATFTNDNQYLVFNRPTTGDFAYIGTASNTTGGPATDLGIRAENNLILGAGGYGADLTIASTGAATFSGNVVGLTFESSVSSSSTNLATNSGGSLTLKNTSVTDGNFSNIGGYNSNTLVTSQINFVNVSQASRTGAITFNVHNGTSMPEVGRFDASGNFLVGKSATAFGTAGIEASASNGLWSTRSGLPALALNRLSTDGSIADFYKDSVLVGSIGTGSGLLTIGTGTGNLLFENALVAPCSDSSLGASNGVVDLGASTRRFKDLYLSGGVYLGGTGSANLLEDYEVGSFTPSFTASTTAPTIAYNTQTASYTKIGNTVTYTIFIVTNSRSGGSGNLSVTGLPFTVATGQDYGSTIGFNYNWETGGNPLYAFAQGSTTGIILYKSANNEHNESDDILASGNSYLRLTGFYYTTG
jgi:hypothetical protein